MKMPKILRRKKLRATTTARRSLRASAEMGYDDLSEPNMKLSRALLIVLVLHIVAVSGIIAFNAIKTRQGSFVPIPPASIASSVTTAEPADIKSEKQVAQRQEAKPSSSAAKTIAKTEHKTDHAKPIEHTTTAVDSGKSYVVLKGDNPVAIAKKFKVSYDELLALNHIDDPRKLQIGQKLLIPKAPKAKKHDE
ncbi:MAG: LysM peptidoglycan-binding domain-containing protein [Verrucomicrobiota bacterium]